MRDIAVAVTCYNNEKEVINFAKHLSKQNIVDRIQLLVTCNAVKNFVTFRNELKDVMPSACVFNPERNLGYLPGCLYGLGKNEKNYSWVMVSNTDIEFKQNDFFEQAIKDVVESVWCIGPDIELPDTCVHQNPFLENRPSAKKIFTWRVAYSCFTLFRLYFKLHDLSSKKELNSIHLSDKKVYALHGSCFFLKHECVQKLMEEKADIFMYGEELLIAEIVRENGKSCYFKANIGILHNENQVTGNIASKTKQKWFNRSIKYLYGRFFSNN